ncbi:MAG TPA: response regulator transcription factor [Pyrinomonadaceae bacterium]|nr:response regulator transcription factor [Pyrinomonadaceae bacterium]
MNKILVIEDQEDLINGLALNLEREGYKVAKALRGDVGIKLAMNHDPDLIVLDVMLPGMSGLDVCRELRARGFERPIIMLTAKSEEIDRVVGLELGADDYVVKPFGLRELLARIRVRLRRQASSRPMPARYVFGKVEINFETMCATRTGEQVVMTAKEYDVLRFFVRCKGEVLTRDRILNEVWGEECHVHSRTIDAHILKLRQKLENNPAEPEYILTVHGEGYKFVG